MLGTIEALNQLMQEMSSDSSEDTDDGAVSNVTLNYCYEKLAQIWS
jgi:hypothetical protein